MVPLDSSGISVPQCALILSCRIVQSFYYSRVFDRYLDFVQYVIIMFTNS